MKNFQLLTLILVTILAINGCKKVEPQETRTQTEIQVTSFAGVGGSNGSYLDGVGQFSAFNTIAGMALDAAGNVYVNDQLNFRIRKITPSGVVSTFAGTGVNGYVDGPAKTAQFSYLEGLAIDASGNLYAADNGNNVIRKITPSGVVSTYAGTGQGGYLDGNAATAKFYAPVALAIDKVGNIYVGEDGNNLIRKVSAAGAVSTYAGTLNTFSYDPSFYNGPANGIVFGPFITGITLDPSGNVYVLDNYNAQIFKITPTGNASLFAGDGSKQYSNFIPYRNGPGILAEFYIPYGITSDGKGNIYIADTNNHMIRKITSDSEVTTLVGNGVAGHIDGKVADARLTFPRFLASNSEGSVIYFAERNEVRKIEFTTTTTKQQNGWNNPQTWGNPK